MALIYVTTISPTKPEILADWLPGQAWFAGEIEKIDPIAAYRFDDPEGEVGIETHLVTAGDGAVYQVPLTYRGSELEGGEDFLLCTMEHDVLGRRWIYDALGDPVYRAAIAAAIAQGGIEAEQFFTTSPDIEAVKEETTTKVRGSGSPGASIPELWAATVRDEGAASIAETDFATLTVVRKLEPTYAGVPGGEVLRGTWPGQESPVVLATLTAQ